VNSHAAIASTAPVTPEPSAAVSISNFKFEPKVLRVKVGTTVTWTNTDGTHSAVADDENFSSPTLAKGKSFSFKFTKRGKYPYYCSFHGSKGGGDMAGTIIVVP
jgi:plastocyanin